MAALIGNGGHARDIWSELDHSKLEWKMIPHHKDWDGKDLSVIIGVNNPKLRADIANELGVMDCDWVHPHAWIGNESGWMHGTHINYGVSMVRTDIGYHCTIAPGVTICGDVTIGNRVFIGAGAVIKNLVSIGDDAFIRMGSIVTRDVAPGERY